MHACSVRAVLKQAAFPPLSVWVSCTVQVEDKVQFIRGDFFEEVQGIKVRPGTVT